MNDFNVWIKPEILCRLCMQLCSSSFDICGTDQAAVEVRIAIHRLFSFWVMNSDSIRWICQNCIKAIKDYDLFHNMVLNNQVKLLQSDNGLNSKNKIMKLEKDSETNDSDILFSDNNQTDVLQESCKNNENEDERSVKNKLLKKKIIDSDKTFTADLIKNGKFIVKNLILEKMAAKFYKIQCYICNESLKFNKLSDMLKHCTSKHNGKGFVTCCDTRLYRRDLIYMHMARHIQPSAFECPICKKKLTRLHALKPHLETHLPAVERSFKCDQCDRSYINNAGLSYHKSRTHIPIELMKKYNCEKCDKTFNLSSTYQSHISTVHEAPKYLCEECGRKFHKKRNYLEHLQTHDESGQNSIQCQHCGFICKNKGSYKTHVKLHNAERFNCTLCQYTTHRKSFLNQHMKVKHTDNRPYSCDICGKAFKLKGSLKSHMVHHTGERKFSCSYCPKKFTASSNYYAHLNKTHYEEHKASLNKKQYALSLTIDTAKQDTEKDKCSTEDVAREKIKQFNFKCRKKNDK